MLEEGRGGHGFIVGRPQLIRRIGSSLGADGKRSAVAGGRGGRWNRRAGRGFGFGGQKGIAEWPAKATREPSPAGGDGRARDDVSCASIPGACFPIQIQWYPTSGVAGCIGDGGSRHRAPGVGCRRDPRLLCPPFCRCLLPFRCFAPAAAEGEKNNDTASSFGLLAVVGHCLAHARCGYASVCYRTSSSVKKKNCLCTGPLCVGGLGGTRIIVIDFF